MSLKMLRIQREYSQEELASLSGLSTRTIQRIEKDSKASCESITALAKAFKLEVPEFEEYLYPSLNIQEEVTNSNNDGFFNYLLNNKKTIRFILINILLIIINLVTNYENLWFPYILIGWGSFHFYKRYVEYKIN
jgi:transcriptional regulator with XRE-family HTH domain